MRNPKPSMDKPRLSNIQQKQQNKIKVQLKVPCDHWEDWRSQIHWKIWNFPCHLNVIVRRLNFVCILTSSF